MRVDHGQAQRTVPPQTKIRIITILLRRVVSEIKLKRTDTTLDLSQKAITRVSKTPSKALSMGVVLTYQRELKKKEKGI